MSGPKMLVIRSPLRAIPPIKLVVEGGIFGDTATVGALINAIPAALNAAPGLQDPLNLPTPRCFLP